MSGKRKRLQTRAERRALEFGPDGSNPIIRTPQGGRIYVKGAQRCRLWCWLDLAADEQADYDWVPEDDHYRADFFRIGGGLYALSEAMRLDDNTAFKDWHGIYNDSAFSGVLVKINDWELNHEEVITAATFYC